MAVPPSPEMPQPSIVAVPPSPVSMQPVPPPVVMHPVPPPVLILPMLSPSFLGCIYKVADFQIEANGCFVCSYWVRCNRIDSQGGGTWQSFFIPKSFKHSCSWDLGCWSSICRWSISIAAGCEIEPRSSTTRLGGPGKSGCSFKPTTKSTAQRCLF